MTVAEQLAHLAQIDAAVKRRLRWLDECRQRERERRRRERLLRQAIEQWELMEWMERELNNPACPLYRKR